MKPNGGTATGGEQLPEIKPSLTFFAIQVGVQDLKCDKTAWLGEHSLLESDRSHG